MSIDERIVKFIKKHHVLTLATLAEGGTQPYVANCFYAYDAERNLFIFTSDVSTRHGAEMEQNPRVALCVVRETRIVGSVAWWTVSRPRRRSTGAYRPARGDSVHR
jgi:uncharacterized protein YhbP (UPF0306 family)